VSSQRRSEMSQQQTFEILDVKTRVYSRFNTRDTQWYVRINPPATTTLPHESVCRFVDRVNTLFVYVLEDS